MRYAGENDDQQDDEQDGGGYPGGNIPGAPTLSAHEGAIDNDTHEGGDIDPGGNSETPRERATTGDVASGNVTSAPRKPMTPDIGAGSVEEHDNSANGGFKSRPSTLSGSAGVIPFEPIGSPMGGPVGTPGGSKSTLFGMAGGLKGGGLGVPSIGGGESGSSSLIDSLMSILKQKKGGMF